MPTYEYECAACGHELEVFQSMKDESLRRCPNCKKLKLHRKIGLGAGLLFKGSGFYETDYKRTGSEKSEAGKDSGTQESKSDDSPKPAPEKATKPKDVAKE